MLILIFILFCIGYFLIKISVKHAISESLEDIRDTISKAICMSRDEYDGKNIKK